MAKRGNGEGNIGRRPDGRWQARATVGYDEETGKQKFKYFYGKTRTEVAERLNAFISDQNKGIAVDPNKITFSELLKNWLDTKRNSGKVKITTYQCYESYTTSHIIPALGKIKLQDLKPTHLQQFYNSKLKNGLSSGTVRKIHVMIHNALKLAIKESLVYRNVSDGLELPKLAKPQFRVLTVDEIKQLRDSTTEHNLYPALLLELHTGIRKGELLALRWKNVDLDNGTISIKENLIVVRGDKEKNTKGQLKFDTPKSNSSIRNIHIPTKVVEVLREHKTKDTFNYPLSKYFWMLEPQYSTHGTTIFSLLFLSKILCDDLVFHTKNGTPIHPRNFSRTYYAWLKKAGINGDVRFHDLRHTHATQLLANKADIVSVKSRLGHSDIRTTSIYTHALAEQDKKISDIMGDILG